MDRKQELQHLAQANRHIAAGHSRIARLEELIVDLNSHECDTVQAQALLGHFRDTMDEWVVHRNLILQLLSHPH